MKPVYIVQTLDTGEFLRPSADGDVGYCMLLKEAGHFNSYESAYETALDNVGELFCVVKFYTEERRRR